MRTLLAAAPQPTDLDRECAAVDFLLRHVGLDPERCRTEGGAINLGRVRSLLEDRAPQPETWSLYVAGMIGAYLKWPVDDTRIAAVAGIIERRRKFDAAPTKAAQPAVAPEGWKLVPVEPTQAMVQAAITARSHSAMPRGKEDAGVIAWKAALAAAPTQAGPAEAARVALTDADIEAVLAPCEGSAFAEHLRREFIKSFKRVYFKLHPERANGIHAQEGATQAQEGGSRELVAPPGYILVPEGLEEPTEYMLEAFQKAFVAQLRKRKQKPHLESAERAGLRAMLKAAPGAIDGGSA